MQYRRDEAKDYARAHFKGIWAAALTPFTPDLRLDEAGLRSNFRHWVDDLGIDGLFVAGKQGEFFSMSVAERKRTFDIAVEERGRRVRHDHVLLRPEPRHGHRAGPACAGRSAPTISSCMRRCCISCTPQDETLFEYYRHRRAGRYRHRAVEPPGQRLSDEPGTVRAHRRASRTSSRSSTACRARCTRGSRASPATRSSSARRRRRNGSTTSSSSAGSSISARRRPTCSDQSDRRMRDYTDLALRGEIARARAVRDSLDPVREAFRRTRPPEKAPRASEVLAGAAGPGRRAGAPAAAGADRGGEGRHPARFRGLRARRRRTALDSGVAFGTML